MPEIDNCPVCNTTCELEFGLEEGAGAEYEKEISYATCKTCKTRWRRRDDPKDFGNMIYEKWTCRIPEITIPFPFVGGGIKLRSRWCRWVRVKEKRIPTGVQIGLGSLAQPASKQRVIAEEVISIKARDHAYYYYKLSKGSKLKGEISSDVPIDVLFLDEKNFDRFERKRNFETEDATVDIYETKVAFVAPKKGNWFIALNNGKKTPAKVKVHLYLEET